MCHCTSLHGDPQPPHLARTEKEEVGRLKREVVEAPGEPQGLCRAPSASPEEVEHQRQEKLRDDGQKMVAMIRVSSPPTPNQFGTPVFFKLYPPSRRLWEL